MLQLHAVLCHSVNVQWPNLQNISRFVLRLL